MALDMSRHMATIVAMDRCKLGRELRPAGAEEGEAKRVDVCPSINEPVRLING